MTQLTRPETLFLSKNRWKLFHYCYSSHSNDERVFTSLLFIIMNDTGITILQEQETKTCHACYFMKYFQKCLLKRFADSNVSTIIFSFGLATFASCPIAEQYIMVSFSFVCLYHFSLQDMYGPDTWKCDGTHWVHYRYYYHPTSLRPNQLNMHLGGLRIKKLIHCDTRVDLKTRLILEMLQHVLCRVHYPCRNITPSLVNALLLHCCDSLTCRLCYSLRHQFSLRLAVLTEWIHIYWSPLRKTTFMLA